MTKRRNAKLGRPPLAADEVEHRKWEGRRFASARLARVPFISQRDLAKALGVHRTTAERWESGDMPIPERAWDFVLPDRVRAAEPERTESVG